MDENERESGWEIWLGIFILTALHLFNFLFPLMFFFIGVSQLIYLIPALIIALYKNKKKMAAGMLIGAGVTFLINATCYGLVMGGMMWH
ncbi:hypothetical protein [Brevibacillus massiliensis]|jgi:hypothetical protein|uniref:hypothetical protein n=1 Tax=Brevibacillus massiliensis TaxID=1118054 RepID=UPI0002EFD8FC|nr:hypothetical protein [Brevibacillus massiliensis]